MYKQENFNWMNDLIPKPRAIALRIRSESYSNKKTVVRFQNKSFHFCITIVVTTNPVPHEKSTLLMEGNITIREKRDGN